MILRIEDTDADRSRGEMVDAIYDSLRWLGIDWEEEYRQSERFERYREVAEDFLARGLAYRCDCTQEAVKQRAEAAGSAGYDGFCRDRDVAPGEGVVIRFRTPEEGTVAWDDLIRGHVSFDLAVIEDFIIVRSNGVPMFHVANAVDDLDMGITHVVRGEDLVNTTPRVLLLRQALGGDDSLQFAHLPLIVNEKRQKLSKRRDDVAVGDYRARGYLPEAMRNYLLTLGWGPKDDVEIGPIEKFITEFDLADINKSPAFFDVQKLDHFNATYIRELSADAFIEAGLAFIGDFDPDVFTRLAPYAQERVKRLDEIRSFLDWVVSDPPEPSEKDWRRAMGKNDEATAATAVALEAIIAALGEVEWNEAAIEAAVLGVGTELGVRTQLPVRLALTGVLSGIPLWPGMVEMERDVVIDRIASVRAKL